MRSTENLRANSQVGQDLNTLISVLESPVFQSILNIQDSLRELKRQVQLHPSILPSDFDITPSGELVLNLPNSNNSPANQPPTAVPNVPTATSTPTPAKGLDESHSPSVINESSNAQRDLMDHSGSLPRKPVEPQVRSNEHIITTRIMISKGMVSKGQSTQIGPGKGFQYSF